MSADNSKDICNNGQPSICKSSRIDIARNVQLVAPDGGWGWIVALASFLTGCLIGTQGVIFPLILEDLIATMNTTRAAALWIPSTHLFLAMLCVPLASAISLRYSTRKAVVVGGLLLFIATFTASFANRIYILIITLGVVAGLGFSFTFAPMLFAINQYFDKRRGRITGILMSGMSFGRFAMTPVVQLVLDHYGFRDTLFILSAIMLNMCVCGAVLQPIHWHLKPAKELQTEDHSPEQAPEKVVNPQQTTNESSTFLKVADNSMKPSSMTLQEDKSAKTIMAKFYKFMKLDVSVLKNPCFFIVCSSNIIHVCVLPYVLAFLPSLGYEKGYESMNTAALMSVLALCEIIGRLFTPWIIDCKLMTLRTVIIIASFFFATILWGITMLQEYYIVAVACGIGGLLSGGMTSTNMMAVANVLGPANFPSVMAFSQFIQSFFTLFIGPLLGLARDYTGKYETCFVIMSCLQYCSVLVWLCEPAVRRRALPNLNKS